jgi:diguanylate cyclase (GGDEF)-like protein
MLAMRKQLDARHLVGARKPESRQPESRQLDARHPDAIQPQGGAVQVHRENALLRSELARLRIALAAQQNEIEALQAHAVQDALLPVLNRRGFVADVMRALSFCTRYRMPATLLYCDLDNFKQINDCHGHDIGDHVLHHTVSVLQDSIRRSDIIGRLGGDEFGLLLWNADAAATQPKLEELQARFANEFCDTPVGQIAVSMSMVWRKCVATTRQRLLSPGRIKPCMRTSAPRMSVMKRRVGSADSPVQCIGRAIPLAGAPLRRAVIAEHPPRLDQAIMSGVS